MWGVIARIAAQLIPPEKLLKVIFFVFCGILAFFFLIFAAPIVAFKHIPLGKSLEHFQFYYNAAQRMQSDTGQPVSWQQIMAIDAVLLDQDFSKSSQQRADSYREYFIEESQEEFECEGPPDEEGKPTIEICYQTVYYLRDFDTVLNMLVSDRKLRSDQIDDVKDYLKYEIALNPAGDWGAGTAIGFIGNFNPKINDYAWPLPLNHTRVTSSFGSRVDPISGRLSQHLGVDFGVPISTPVYAIQDGIIRSASYSDTAGNSITIDHGNGMVSKYMHLSGFAVSRGTTVQKGQLIAYSGNTGRSTGPHLHFQIEINGNAIDPLLYY